MRYWFVVSLSLRTPDRVTSDIIQVPARRYSGITEKYRLISSSAVGAPDWLVPPVTPNVDAVTTPFGLDDPSPVMKWPPEAFPIARPAWRAR